VIKIIGMEGEVMPSTIGNYTGMDNSSLTRMIDNLENKEMVFRKNDPKDRRKVIISLTNKGLKCYKNINKAINNLFRLMDETDVDEYSQSLATMSKFIRKIENQLRNKSQL
jgi:MarR family transcriptional regulator, organic hydroperoxide resistance regulator